MGFGDRECYDNAGSEVVTKVDLGGKAAEGWGLDIVHQGCTRTRACKMFDVSEQYRSTRTHHGRFPQSLR